MRYVLLVLLLVACSSYGQAGNEKIDVYRFCQLHIDRAKIYSKLPAKELVKIKSNIAAADSLESLSEAAEIDSDAVNAFLQNRNKNVSKVSDEEAKELMMSFLKSFVIPSINLAITMRGVSDELQWNNKFDECVAVNRDSL